jgi:hypothetical protein
VILDPSSEVPALGERVEVPLEDLAPGRRVTGMNVAQQL